MSSTRSAKKGSPVRQERYASSEPLPKGLLGNLIAKRCQVLESSKDRELIFFLHEMSLRSGFDTHYSCSQFPNWPFRTALVGGDTPFSRIARELVELFPGSTKNLRSAELEIEQYLLKFCLDPKIEFAKAGVKKFSNLIEALREYHRRAEDAFKGYVAQTKVTREIYEALYFALNRPGRIVLIEGHYRSGKTFSAQSWALSHLGKARYVQLSSAADEASFFRSIARSVGVACSVSMKADQLRTRVEEALRGQQILMIFDEADYFWPQTARLSAAPSRVNWLMTALVNQSIPVCLIGSANFTRAMHNTERRAVAWGSEQFRGRIALHKTLPDGLDEEDLFAIAKILLPGVDEATRTLLVGFALESKGRVANIETAAQRARFFAERENRGVKFQDVRAAMIEAGYKFDDAESAGIAPSPGDQLSTRHRPRERSADGLRGGRGIPLGPRLPALAVAGTGTDLRPASG